MNLCRLFSSTSWREIFRVLFGQYSLQFPENVGFVQEKNDNQGPNDTEQMTLPRHYDDIITRNDKLQFFWPDYFKKRDFDDISLTFPEILIIELNSRPQFYRVCLVEGNINNILECLKLPPINVKKDS